MKALSVRQPHASRIAAGRKTIEMRCWPTDYRGPLVICATARPKIEDLPSGMAVCIVDLVDCRPLVPQDQPLAMHPYLAGHWAWVLRNPQAVEPFVVKGRLGLFDVDLPYEQERLFG